MIPRDVKSMTRAEKVARRVCHWLIAVRDLRRLNNRFPPLRSMRDDVAEAMRELRPSWSAYVGDDIWMKDQAISLELSATLLVLCRALQPSSILDLGSGYSSCVFRQYAMNVRPEPYVCSVDDNPAWLERTERVLAERGLRMGAMTTWGSFMPEHQFDLILHDLGGTAVRKATVDRVCGLVSETGTVVLDDAHHYRSALLAAVRRAGLEAFSLRLFTLDDIGRYAFLAARRRQP